MDRYEWLLLRLQIENRPTSMRGACGWSSSQFVPRWRLATLPRTQPSNALNVECCHLNLNLQELDLDSSFFTYLRPNAFMIVRGGRAWGRSLDYHAQKVFTDSENVHHLHILLCLVLRAIGSSSRSFDFHIRNTRPIKGMVECY